MIRPSSDAKPFVQLSTAQAYTDPHKVLGVDVGADEKEVKRAYKKLALRLHPDVSDDEKAEAKFRTLREAYELLLGKGDASKQRQSPFGGNWEFHDWYWTFSMRHRQRRQASGSKEHSSCAAQAHRPKVNSQLQGLKERARHRRGRCSTSDVIVEEADMAKDSEIKSKYSVEAPTVLNCRKDVESSTVSSSCAQGNRHDMGGLRDTLFQTRTDSCDPDLQSHESSMGALQTEGQTPAEGGVQKSTGVWSTFRDHVTQHRKIMEGAIMQHHMCMQNATQRLVGVSVEVLAGGNFNLKEIWREVHMHSHDGKCPEFSESEDPTHQPGNYTKRTFVAGQEHASTPGSRYCVREGNDDTVDEPKVNNTGRRFVSTDERRNAVHSQLAGLRRKAQLHSQ